MRLNQYARWTWRGAVAQVRLNQYAPWASARCDAAQSMRLGLSQLRPRWPALGHREYNCARILP